MSGKKAEEVICQSHIRNSQGTEMHHGWNVLTFDGRSIN